MRGTGGRGARGEAFGSRHLQRCLGLENGLPLCAPRGGLRDPLGPRNGGGIEGSGGGLARGAGRGDFFLLLTK